jgi:Protein of unknown function (DUF3667)
MQNHPTEFHPSPQCLNCGMPLIDVYCAHCGQKKLLHKHSFWHMVLHFIGDYFHYDGKFLLTVKTMFTHAGKITMDFVDGKRARFLNPIQFYFFVSTIFFLFFFTNNNESNKAKVVDGIVQEYQNTEIKKPFLKNLSDSVSSAFDEADSTDFAIGLDSKKNYISIGKWTPKFPNHQTYLNAQTSLPITQHDSWFKKLVIKQYFKINYLQQKGVDIEQLYFGKVKQSIPKVLFILLPLFALLLKVFFKKSNLFYVDHAIHSIHLHSFLFIIILFSSWFLKLPLMGMILNVFSFIVFILTCFYFTLSFKNVYQNTWGITIIKQLFLFSIYFICFSFLLIALILLAFFMI